MNRRPSHRLADSNPMKISNYKEMELIYFCLQYPEMKKEVCTYYHARGKQTEWTDNTYDQAIRHIEELEVCIKMIEDTCREVCNRADTDEDIYPFLLKGVTEGKKFTYLRTKCDMKCGRNKYYKLWHEYYYILSHKKHMF